MKINMFNKKHYNNIHQWNLRNWSKLGVCEICGLSRKTQWANKDKRYLFGDKTNWLELCSKCHANYDKKLKKLPKCKDFIDLRADKQVYTRLSEFKEKRRKRLAK